MCLQAWTWLGRDGPASDRSPLCPGTLKLTEQAFQCFCHSATSCYNARQPVSPPLALSPNTPTLSTFLPPFLAGCRAHCLDSCSNDVVGGRALFMCDMRQLNTSTWWRRKVKGKWSQRMFILRKSGGKELPCSMNSCWVKRFSVKLYILCSLEFQTPHESFTMDY